MKLRVKNLAKIEEAEVDIKNLTLFVGQNSTNKSYMAHVIYKLLTLLNYDLKELREERKNIARDLLGKSKFILDHIISKKMIREEDNFYTQVIFSLDKAKKEFKELTREISCLTNKAIIKLINKSFNNETKILGNLIFEKNLINNLFYDNQREIRILYGETDKLDDSTIVYIFLNDIFESIFLCYKNELSGCYNNIQYFPASKTGFVLAFDEIVSGLLDKYKGQPSSARLTEPTIDFIRKYLGIRTNTKSNPENKNYQSNLTNFLQENIIKGTIEEEKLENNYKNFYLKTQNNTKLDLHLASSATLEILPFVVFLKDNSDIKNTFFVIEEPESHLHPKAQIQMAKFIVLLANTGAKVLLTTHSDYILNEINNCIKLNSLEKENKFKILKEDVSAYLFKNEEAKTTATKLKIDKFGISNDNFDEALDELLDKSNELNEKISDND